MQPTSTSANVVNSSGTFESNANNQDIVLDFALASPITQISFNLERPSNGFTIAFTVAFDGCLADTDRDGIFNYLDPDSDGDGCLDVVESGGVDANNNGVLDGTGFAANGRVTGGIGGYNGAGATYNNANRLVITSNPADQTVSTGDPSTTFTVEQELTKLHLMPVATQIMVQLGMQTERDNTNGTTEILITAVLP